MSDVTVTPNLPHRTLAVRLDEVEEELEQLRADLRSDVADIKADIREMRSDVLGALQARDRVQQQWQELVGHGVQAVLQPSWSLIILLALLLAGAGLLSATDIGELWAAFGVP